MLSQNIPRPRSLRTRKNTTRQLLRTRKITTKLPNLSNQPTPRSNTTPFILLDTPLFRGNEEEKMTAAKYFSQGLMCEILKRVYGCFYLRMKWRYKLVKRPSLGEYLEDVFHSYFSQSVCTKIKRVCVLSCAYKAK